MTSVQQEPPRVAGRPPLRIGERISGVWRPRSMLVAFLGLVATLVAMAFNIGRGDYPIGIVDVVKVIFGGGDDGQHFIVMELRMPRALTGALVGAALGMSGALTQAIVRNPLASPDILGISAGATAAAVAVIVLGGTSGVVSGTLGSVGLPLAALAGGLTTAVVIYLLAYSQGIEGYRLILVGIAVNAVLQAIVWWLLTVGKVTDAARATVWLTGSLNARGWEHVKPVALALAILVPLALVLTFVLGALQLGDDTARGLGVRVGRTRTFLLLVACGLAAVATASAGPILFVGLVAPQIAVRLAGTSRPPLLASMTIGAALVVGSDVIARTCFGSVELPVGIVTAILGAPFLLYLLARTSREVRI